MDVTDRLRYRARQRESTDLYNSGNYEEVLKSDMKLAKEYPEQKTAIYYSMIAAAAKMEDYTLSCRFIKEILDEGGWYSEMILRQSPSLYPLQGLSEFEDLVTTSIARSKQSQKPKSITVIPESKNPPYPLIVSLHGGGGFIEDEYEHWKPIVDQGYILGIPRSNQLFWSGKDNAYWPDYETTVKQTKNYIAKINEDILDPKRMILGGFSQGGSLALQMVLTHDISAFGFIVVAPGGGMIDEPEKWQSLIDKNKPHNIRGIIIRGTEDLVIPRDRLRSLSILLNEHKIPCEFLEYPKLGHWYPPDLINLVSSYNMF